MNSLFKTDSSSQYPDKEKKKSAVYPSAWLDNQAAANSLVHTICFTLSASDPLGATSLVFRSTDSKEAACTVPRLTVPSCQLCSLARSDSCHGLAPTQLNCQLVTSMLLVIKGVFRGHTGFAFLHFLLFNRPRQSQGQLQKQCCHQLTD